MFDLNGFSSHCLKKKNFIAMHMQLKMFEIREFCRFFEDFYFFNLFFYLGVILDYF